MIVYNTSQGIIINHNNSHYIIDKEWNTYINNNNVYLDTLAQIESSASISNGHDLINNSLLKPIQNQEIWASGVTYYRSKIARVEESKDAGGGDFYDRVYEADRPELFFKSTADRAVGHGDHIRIRKDSKWNVPEPELTLVVTSSGKIIGYTIGNDVSSRDIEGENPLYLPQAKTYDGAAAIGPGVFITPTPLSSDTNIHLKINRNNTEVFSGSTELSQMKRNPEELVSYLFREMTFPHGCYLMTGTGVVPPDSFTMVSGDEVQITIDSIGTLINTVA